MNNYNSKIKFKSIKEPSHYLRVDEIHPLELLVGRNDNGKLTLRLIGDFTKVNIKGTRTIMVNHYNYQKKLAVNFSLNDDAYEDLFYLFCNDLIDSSRNSSPKDGYSFLVNRYEKWKNFGSTTRKFLSENEVKGLIGELLCLKDDLSKKYGWGKSILGWTGTEPLKKDFSFEDHWYEIKVASSDKVTISSIEQLDSNYDGYLVIYFLEKMSSEAKGITLNKLFDDVLLKLENDNDRALLIIKAAQSGYYKEEYYEQFVFRVMNKCFYKVTKDFPIINKELLPNAVSNVKYDLIINMLSDFKRDEI